MGRIPANQDMTWIAEHHPERKSIKIRRGINLILNLPISDEKVCDPMVNYNLPPQKGKDPANKYFIHLPFNHSY